jgi:hypothetical protein
LQGELEDLKILAIMHGANPKALETQEAKIREEKLPEAADLMKYGFGSTAHPRLMGTYKRK